MAERQHLAELAEGLRAALSAIERGLHPYTRCTLRRATRATRALTCKNGGNRVGQPEGNQGNRRGQPVWMTSGPDNRMGQATGPAPVHSRARP